MKCLYCHENVQPEGDVCPKCGLPLIEDTTLLELGGPEKPSFMDWLNERKPIIIAAAGGFVAALAIGVLIISAHTAGEPAPVNQATNPAVTFQQPAPVQMASRTTDPMSVPTALPSGHTETASAAPIPPVLSTPAVSHEEPLQPAPTAEPAPAVTPVGEEQFSAPPALPKDFDYDPAWNFPRPPQPSRKPKKRPDPVLEPTPPSHALAQDPFRTHNAVFVTIVPSRGVVDVSNVSGGNVRSLPSIIGE
jgi:hypothetical protein